MQPTPPAAPVSLRSYATAGDAHTHDFSQFVLPLRGALDIELEGRGAVLDKTQIAYVAPGARHAQAGLSPNTVLVVDFHPQALAEPYQQKLSDARFLPVTPASSHLIDYLGVAASAGDASPHLHLWLPLLIETLAGAPASPPSRLARLLAALDATDLPHLTVAGLALRAGLSTSRLHTLFLKEIGMTPHAWLSERKLTLARQLLADPAHTIAEIAYRAGYADQSALTRAFTKATGMPPAAYRRQRQENWPSAQ